MLFLHVVMGMLVQESMEAKGIESPGARVTESCDLPDTSIRD